MPAGGVDFMAMEAASWPVAASRRNGSPVPQQLGLVMFRDAQSKVAQINDMAAADFKGWRCCLWF
jgi:hypothetical protein